MTHKQTGKNLEKSLAVLLKLTRVSVQNFGKRSCDLLGRLKFKPSALVACEVKLRGVVPKLIEDMLIQAEGGSPDGYLPVALLKRKNDKYDDTIVAMKLSDFRKILK